MIKAISKINTTNKVNNQLKSSRNSIVQEQQLNSQNLASVPSDYHRGMFNINQNISKVSFKGITPQEANMIKLKASLSQICHETIDNYTSHKIQVSQNLFTRGYIHHCFDFVEKKGDDLHNVHDPLWHLEWQFLMDFSHKMTHTGNSVLHETRKRMTGKIDSWNEKFIATITAEKKEKQNPLIDELLVMDGDVDKIKSRLGINF